MTASRTEPDTAPLQAAVYCRISHDVEGTGQGVDRQRDACLALAAAKGWSVDARHIFIENNQSASTGRRREYEAMVQLARDGQVDVIVAWAVDRLTRKVTEIEALIEMATASNITIATVSGDLDLSTDSGRLVGRILASVARGEVERKGARQVAANRQRAEQGRPPARRAVGYRKDGTVDPVEAAEVAAAFSRFVAGASITAIVDDWNARGVLNTVGRPWAPSGLRDSVLRNPRYIAERWMTRRVPGQRDTITYVGPGDWTPIVDVDVYRAAQARLDDPARRNSVSSARKYLGTGLYRCGECSDGSGVKSKWNHSGHGPEIHPALFYVCLRKGARLGAAAPIDDHVQAEIVRYLRNNRLSDLLADDRNVAAVKTCRDKVSALRLRLKGFDDALTEGDLTPAEYRRHTDTVNAKLLDAEQALAALGTRSAVALLEGADDPGAAWLALGVIEKSKVAQALCVITVRRGAGGRRPFDPSSVTIEWTRR